MDYKFLTYLSVLLAHLERMQGLVGPERDGEGGQAFVVHAVRAHVHVPQRGVPGESARQDQAAVRRQPVHGHVQHVQHFIVLSEDVMTS